MNRLQSFWADFRIVLGERLSRLPWVIVLMLLSAALDLLGIGLIAPFLQAAFRDAPAAPMATESALESPTVWLLGLTVLAVFALRGLAQFQLQRAMIRFSDHLRGEVMSRLLGKYLRQPWEFHLLRSHADLTKTLLYEVAQFSGSILNALLRLFADGLVLIAIGIFLFVLSHQIALSLAALLGTAMVLINLLTRHPMRTNAERIVRRYEAVVSTVGNSLGSLKQARVLGSDRFFTRQLARSTREQAEATALQNALQTIPRSGLELAIVTFMLGIGLYLGRSPESASQTMALLGTFAVAGLRLVPSATSVTNQINLLRANRPVLGRLAADLALADEAQLPTDPGEGPPHELPAVQLQQASYRYPKADAMVFRSVDLALAAGDCVGLVGRSGSGKSTLADLLMGLISPTEGQLLVDNAPVAGAELNWTRRCAYIAQSSCLFNDTLRANITMGDDSGPEVDAGVCLALKQAAVESLLDELPLGLDEPLGDEGQRISGGQRQRVAIARAFYHRREFLVLDEATSALDAATEQEIVAAIRQLRGSATILIIAHRESTLAPCDRIYRLVDGRLQMLDSESSA